jgi:serine/threonine protein kinase
MSAETEQARWSSPQTGSTGAALLWLDALASGVCTPDAFLDAVRVQFQTDVDKGWEVLSLLDQYYRRGKIKAELFHTIKSRLESSALSVDNGVAAGAQPPPAIIVTAPATASQDKASPDSQSGVGEVAIGDVLRGRYRIRGVVGRGGMGTVFEAVDQYRLDLPTTDSRLAVKVLHTAVTQREALLAELQRELQHLQLLSHPNIVRAHEFDRDGDIAFFTMELLDGALLSGVLSARNAIALPRPYALAVMRDVGAALSYAHSRGVLHGDINPQNIFITNDGEVRVLDFGASNGLLRDRWTDANELSQRIPVATPGYASCQLLEGQHPDARDDLFAYACVTYVLLSGRHPFPNRTALEACAQGLRPARPPGLTRRQWRVLQEGLRWERERRPSDVQKWLERFEFAAAAPRLPPLPALVNAPPPTKSRAALAAALIALFALLAGGGYWAVTDYDSLAQHVMEWNRLARSALDGAGASPAAPAPVVTHPAAPPGAVSRAAPAPRANPAPAPIPPALPTSPAAVSQAASAPRANLAPAPIPQALPTPTRVPRTAAVARPSTAQTSAGAVHAEPIRISLAADTVDVQANYLTAHVTVHRTGNLRGEASFTWWTESGTAKPGRDFVPVMPRVEHIADGSSSITLSIPVSGASRTQPRSFYVVIGRTKSGAALGARTLTLVTLLSTD